MRVFPSGRSCSIPAPVSQSYLVDRHKCLLLSREIDKKVSHGVSLVTKGVEFRCVNLAIE